MAADQFNDGPVDLSVLGKKDYESLFRQYYQWLCLQASKITGSWDAAEDIVQEFFTRCWQNRATLQVKESFAGFALVSVRNGALNWRKKESTRLRHETASFSITGESAPAPAGQPDEIDRRYLDIITAVNKLPEQRRKAFILSRQHHMKYTDIAVELDISVNTVKMHIRLAYQELRSLLKIGAPLFLFFKIF